MRHSLSLRKPFTHFEGKKKKTLQLCNHGEYVTSAPQLFKVYLKNKITLFGPPHCEQVSLMCFISLK